MQTTSTAMAPPDELEFWLNTIFNVSGKEIYIIDAHTLRFVQASASALKRLRLSLPLLREMSPQDVFSRVDDNTLRTVMQAHADQHQACVLIERIKRPFDRDSTELRLYYAKQGKHEALLALGHDQATVHAMHDSEERFQAIVANIPGLVFQCRVGSDNRIQFDYLSQGCKALLGLSPDELYLVPERFVSLILVDDQMDFITSMRHAASEQLSWNWEGRIWIEAWQDIKVINLRASFRRGNAEEVQFAGIMNNITESKREKLEIEQSHARLAELSAHLVKAREEERIHIAREIHDDLGGNLSAIKIGLMSLKNKLSGEQAPVLQQLERLSMVIDQTFESVHRIASDLRPDILELGIVAAIEWQARSFEQQMETTCDFSCNQEHIKVSPEQAITLFRICQEALSNIAKYAQASQVDILLQLRGDEVVLIINDDGIGISPEDQLKQNSFGLRGMMERAAAVNGSCAIGPGVQKGTRVRVTLPLSANDES